MFKIENLKVKCFLSNQPTKCNLVKFQKLLSTFNLFKSPFEYFLFCLSDVY